MPLSYYRPKEIPIGGPNVATARPAGELDDYYLVKFDPADVTTIELQFPPSVNTAWRWGQLASGQRMMMLTARQRKFRADTVGRVMEQKIPRQYGAVAVEIDLHPPTARSYDADNFFKATLDALTAAGVWVDDKQIWECSAIKRPIIKGGRAIVTIIALEGGKANG